VAAVLTSSAFPAFHSRHLVALRTFDLLLWIVNGGNKLSVPDSTQDKLLPFLLLASNALRITQAARRDGFSFHLRVFRAFQPRLAPSGRHLLSPSF
jgi:hypothetical protein